MWLLWHGPSGRRPACHVRPPRMHWWAAVELRANCWRAAGELLVHCWRAAHGEMASCCRTS
eukprot:6924573-Lingulodinium_polyedra.AAC.1